MVSARLSADTDTPVGNVAAKSSFEVSPVGSVSAKSLTSTCCAGGVCIDIKRFIINDYVSALDVSKQVLTDVSKRVIDLVYDYSIDSFSKTLSKGRWPEHTIPEGAIDEVSTKFLVSEITRDRRTIAKLATVETSGEDYKSIITNIKNYDLLSEKQRPIQTVLNNMLDDAEGFVVLMDPGDEEKDETYHDLFLTIHENLEKRARMVFKQRLDAEVNTIRNVSKESKGALVNIFEDMFKERLKSNQGKSRIAAIKADLMEKLKAVGVQLKAQDETVLIDASGQFLGQIEKAIEMTNPDTFARTQQKIQEMKDRNELDKDTIFKYYLQLCSFCADSIDAIASNIFILEESSDIDQDKMFEEVLEQKAREKIYRECDLDDTFIINTEVFTERFHNIRRFKNLKYISIVTTKCDMYPIIYPPEDYPRYKLLNCERYLTDIKNFLRILGGDLGVYHSSATGYSVQRDIGRYPGAGSTLTPINIVEPLFKMLNIEKDDE